jgi:hypothetical protein
MAESPTGRPQPPAVEAAKAQQLQIMQTALRGAVPRFTANSCGVAQTASDLALVLISNNLPVATVNMSYPTAKLLSSELLKAIKKYEKLTQHEIEDYNQVANKMREQMEKENAKSI